MPRVPARPDAVNVPQPRLTSPRLIGRTAERDLLVRAVTRQPAVVLLEGEAGVGKTRMTTEVLTAPALDGLRRLVGGCHRLREPFPLGPLLDSLRQLGTLPPDLNPVVGCLRALLPEMAAHLPPAPEALNDARAERHRVFRAVTALLASLGPTVCVVEDAHWADETTLEFLRLLTAAQPPQLSLLVTYRPEDVDHGSPLTGLAARLPASTLGLRLALEPLDVEDVGRLVGAILDTDEVSDEFAEYLHAKTSGLPFAVEEVLRLMQERRDLVRRDGRWARQVLERLAVPAAVRDSIRERVARLDADARLVADCLAVLARPSSDELVAAATGLPLQRVRDGLAAGVTSGLLTEGPDGASQYRHALAGESLYAELPAPRRRRLHLAAAQALPAVQADPPPVAQLAFHYGRARRPAEAARYAEAAAELAGELHDDAGVCRFLQQALAWDGMDRATRVRLAARLAEAALHAFDHIEAAATLRRIIDTEPLDPGQRGELRRRLGILLAQAGDTSAGVVEMERAVAELADRPVLALRTMLSLAAPWVVEGTVDDHRRWLALGEATDAPDGTTADRIGLLVDRATALTSLADAGAAAAEEAIPPDADTVAERRVLQRGCLNVAQAALYIGAFDRAEHFLARFAKLAERTPSALLDGLHRTTGVLLDWHVGRWDDLGERAEALCRSMADVPHAAVDVETVAALLQLARVADPAGAVERLTPLLDTARRTGSIPVLALAAGGLADAHLSQGRPDAALRACRSAMDVLEAKRTWGWAGDVAPQTVAALIACERFDEAGRLAARLVEETAHLDAPNARAAALLARARLTQARGDLDVAATQLAAAADAWDALPRPYEAARARLERARCLLRSGDPGGEATAVTALEALRPLHADGEAVRVRRVLRGLGARLPYRWQGGRRGYGTELSPRESAVAQRVVDGMTNREIAAELFLSVRTVEFHVAKCMRKLGAATRRELAGRMQALEETR